MRRKYPKTKLREENLFEGEYVATSCVVGDKIELGYSLSESIGTCPENMTTCGYMSSASRFLAYSNGYVYSSLRGASFMQLVSLAADSPFCIEQYEGGQAQGIIVGNSFAVIHTGTYQTSHSIGGNLKCGTMHYGRLFGIDKSDGNIVRWSGEGGVFDWESGGFLHLRRGIGIGLGIFCLGERLAVLREYGVTELSAYGNYENYKQGIPTATDKVLLNSGATALGKLYFFTESGLKCYDDGEVTNISARFSEGVTAIRSSICWGQTYIASCTHTDFGEVLFVYDTLKGCSYIIDTTTESMCVGDGVFIFKGGRSYKLEKSTFTFQNTADFDTERAKALKRVNIDGDGEYDLTVSNGRVKREFTKVSGEIRLSMTGREFTFTLKGDSEIKSFTATAEVIDGV